MDEEERRILIRNKEYIARELVASGRTDVIYELKECGVLSEDRAFAIMKHETTITNQMRILLTHLEGCRAGTFQKFMEVLMRLGLGHVVKYLDRRSYEQHRGSLSGESDELDDLQRTPFIQNIDQDQPNIDPLPSLPRPPLTYSSTEPKVPRNDDLETNYLDEPLEIKVIPYLEVGGCSRPPAEVYKNNTMPRGLVFMANYKDFVNNEHTSREGSEIDVKNLTVLLSQMGYMIPKQHINLNKYETIKALREFLSHEELKSVDSCIVIIMSHGRDEKSFYTSDNLYITVNDVVERFSNKECPALKGKPKIFIFQYCRGSGPDVGVEATPQRVVYSRGLNVQTDSAHFGEAVVHRDPTFTDMYIVYSTVEGFVSFRHPNRGSWLMEAICHVFMNNAHNSELESLMKMVSRRVRENYTDDGSKQVCEFVQRAFDRHFYFNPEPLSYTGSLNMDALSRVLSEASYLEGAASSPLLSVGYHQHLKPRRLSCGSIPEPPQYEKHHQVRHRNLSGASNSSEKGLSESAVVHPRLHHLSGNQSFHQPTIHWPHKSLDRGFSEQAQGFQDMTLELSEDAKSIVSGNEMFSQVTQTDPTSGIKNSYDIVDNPYVYSGAKGKAPHPYRNESESSTQITITESSFISGKNSPLPTNKQLPLVQLDEELRNPQKSYSCTSIREEQKVREQNEKHYPFKRQISIPSTKETLAKINDVRKFLQVHESDPQLVEPLQRIESFVNKKRYEGKRRKVDDKECHSLDFDSS